MDAAYWIPVCAFILLVLGWSFWFVRYRLAERRKAQFAAKMAAYSQKIRPSEPDPNREISVAELVARIEAERRRDVGHGNDLKTMQRVRDALENL